MDYVELGTKVGTCLIVVAALWLFFKGIKMIFKLLGTIVAILVLLWLIPPAKEFIMGLFS